MKTTTFSAIFLIAIVLAVFGGRAISAQGRTSRGSAAHLLSVRRNITAPVTR